MENQNSNTRIAEVVGVPTPAELLKMYPTTPMVEQVVASARRDISSVLKGASDRFVVVVGPCSIHDPEAALDYARRLESLAEAFKEELVVVMRVYFEKPRTTVGWKGLINDPHLNESFDVNTGLHLARSLLLDINTIGLPCATEFLDPISPQYIADLVAWGAIGARTTESQIHRELVSGLSCPIGFKNGTDGGVKVAIDAMRASATAHNFLGVTKDGQVAVMRTTGNPDTHLILRGGGGQTNYAVPYVKHTCDELALVGLRSRVMIDCSHGNSGKDYRNQLTVVADVAGQVALGRDIIGVMIESHISAGRQDLVLGQKLQYGVSVTDACIDWEDTVTALSELAQAVRRRRKALAGGRVSPYLW